MKNTFLLREEFKNWLLKVVGLPLPTVNSYLSYVAGADKTFGISHEGSEEETNLFEVLSKLVKNGDYFGMDSAIIAVINELQQEKIEEKLRTPLNTIRNWKSGLFQYREFLYSHIETQNDSTENTETIENEIDKNELSTPNYESFNLIEDDSDVFIALGVKGDHLNYTFTSEDLYKIFTFRIITQDRFYKDIFYPISFIKRFLYKKGEKLYLDNWVRRLLDNVQINLEDEQIMLREIASLEIINQKVYVTHKGISKIALTKLSNNETLLPFEVKALRSIAIDHDKPLYNIMLENSNHLPTFIEITSELKKYLRGTINPSKLKKANNKVLNSEYINFLNIENLKKELDFLLSKTSLQLMDSKQNLIKKTFDKS